MTRAPVIEPVLSGSLLNRLLHAEVELGLAMADDPANANLPDLHPRVTTISSAWFADCCPVCKDTFRQGDRVRLCPACSTAYHDDDEFDLRCWEARFRDGSPCRRVGDNRFQYPPPCPFRLNIGPALSAGPRSGVPSVLIGQFLGGLESVWRPYGEREAIHVMPGSRLVGMKCQWCPHRVRAGDHVVLCPCGCGTPLHQDVPRRLTCWNEWYGPKGIDFCPATGRPLNMVPR